MALSISNLGSILKFSALQGPLQCKVSGVSYLMAYYYPGNEKHTHTGNYAVWNLATGTGFSVASDYGQVGPAYPVFQQSDGTVIISHTNGENTTDGYLVKLDIVGQTATRLTHTEGGAYVPYSYSDGWIILGTYAAANLYPYLYWSSNGGSSWSNVAINPGSGYGTGLFLYECFLSSNRLYAYCNVSQQGVSNPLSALVCVELANPTNQVFYFKTDSGAKNMYESSDHLTQYYTVGSTYYQLNGLSAPTVVGGLPAGYISIFNRDSKMWATSDYTISDNSSLGPTQEGSVIPTVASGPGTLPTYTAQTVYVTSGNPTIGLSDKKYRNLDRLVMSGADYGPVFTLDGTTNATSGLGSTGGNVYDIKWDNNRKVYIFGSYSRKVGEFNPDNVWSNTNPAQISANVPSSVTHPQRFCFTKNGYYWFCNPQTQYVAWVQPPNYASGSYIDFGGSNCDIKDMIPIRAGSYVAVSYSLSGVGNIGMIHSLDKAILNTIVLSGVTDFGVMCEALRPGVDTPTEAKGNVGHIICIQNTTAGSTIRRINTYTGDLIWSTSVTGTIFEALGLNTVYYPIQMGPDGNIWFWNWPATDGNQPQSKNNLCKVNPMTGAVTTVKTSTELESAASGSSYPVNLCWHGNNLYGFSQWAGVHTNTYVYKGLF